MEEETVNKLAKESGFSQRASKLTPKAFLETAFMNNMDSSPSLNQYCGYLSLKHGISVSKQNIDKRLKNNCKDFIYNLVEDVLANQIDNGNQLSKVKEVFPEIRLMDSTEFTLPKNLSDDYPGYGGQGREAMAQIQFEYDMLSNKISKFSLGHSLQADVTEGLEDISSLPEGSLLVRDMAYFNLSAYERINKAGLYYISKLKPQSKIYTREKGELVELTRQDIIKKIKKTSSNYIDIDVYIGKEKLMPVRLMANLLNEDQKNNQLNRRKARKGKTYTNKNDEINASLNIFISNISREKLSVTNIYAIYRLRWQIELIFKSWKSILNIEQIGQMNSERFQSVMYLKFLWVLLNWSIITLYSRFLSHDLSLYKTTQTLKYNINQFQQALAGGQSCLQVWLIELFYICCSYNKKEYKKGYSKINKVLMSIY